MATQTSIPELRNMQVADLRRELKALRAEVAKLRIGLKLGKHKDSGSYKSAKRQIARMLMLLSEKRGESLQSASPDRTVPAAKRRAGAAPTSKKRTSSPKKSS